MKTVRKILFRLAALCAPLLMSLALGAPPSQAAGAIIVVDDGPSADDCGSYNNKTANPLLQDAVSTAATGSTIVVCPGAYTLTGPLTVTGKKLTIKRALTGAGSRPIVDVEDTAGAGLAATDSSITLDGLVIDGRGNGVSYNGVLLTHSSAAIKNTTILGPNIVSSAGVYSDDLGHPEPQTLSISATNILGYGQYGVFVQGRVKLSLTGSTLDGTDGGRVTPVSAFQSAVFFNGGPNLGETPSGSVSKSRIANHVEGVVVGEVSKVSISGNTLINNGVSIHVFAGDLVNNADNTKITGNTIIGVPADGFGIRVEDFNVAASTVKNTIISKNVIAAAQYDRATQPPFAVFVSANAPATSIVTVTLTGNTLLGFGIYNRVANDGLRAHVTEKGTDATP